MNTITWILQGLLAFVFFMAGAMKLAQPRQKVISSGGKWAEDFSAPVIKLIGVIEVLIAVGLVIPRWMELERSGELTMAAVAGVLIVMAGAFYTHMRRKERPFLIVTAVIFLMGAALAWLTCPACH